MARRARSILKALCAKTFGIAQNDVRRLRESRLHQGLARQCRFRLLISPGLVGNAAQRKPRILDDIAIDFEAAATETSANA